MNNIIKTIGFIIGFLIGSGISMFIIELIKERYDYHNSLDRWAKKLSKDRPFERRGMGCYTIYANGIKWELDAWVGCKLVSFWNFPSEHKFIEYEATWLPRKIMKRSIRHIIFHHPNLKSKYKL